ncbi:hypothetical protein Tco_1441055 [Tanacetum coccineum]
MKGQDRHGMNTREKQEKKAPCTKDLEVEDEAHLRTPIAIRKAQGIRKITLKANIVKEGTGSLNYEEKSPVSKMMISPNLGINRQLQRSKRSIPEKLPPTEEVHQRPNSAP